MWKNKSIFQKMFIGTIVMIIITLAIYYGFTFHYQYKKSINKSLVESVDLSKKINMAMNDYIVQVDGTISSIYYELYQNKDGALSMLLKDRDSFSVRDKLQMNDSIKKFFSQLFLMRRDFVDVYLYINKNKKFEYSTSGGARLDYSPVHENWYRETLERDGETNITIDYIPKQITYKKPVIGFSRVIKNVADEGIEKNTVLMLDFTMKNLNQLIGNYITNDMTMVMFVDSKGDIIYKTGAEIKQEDKLWRAFKNSGEYAKVQKLGSRKYIVASSREMVYDWQVVIVTDYNYAMRQNRDYLFFTIILGALLIMVSAVVSYFFARAMFRPINRLKTGMQTIRTGNFDIILKKDANDELGSLIDSFNLMAVNTKQLIREKYEEELEKKDAQYKFLQAQIDPHFIFNSLQIISSMAVVNRTPEIETLSNSLARLIRYSISGDQKTIPIKKELQNVQSYLAIQKIRFKDRLGYEICSDPQIENIEIIKLILQPIVENGIHHGLEDSGNGYIRISGYLEGDTVCLEIKDNGIGMSDEDLKILNQEMNQMPKSDRKAELEKKQEQEAKEKGNHVGLRNINLRLKLYYGEDYGLTILSKRNAGTSVIIRIPYKEAE